MELTKELIQKAETAKTAEELLKLAKAEGVELSQEEAARYFSEFHKTGELSDDELDNVAGGCIYESGDTPKFSVGQRIALDGLIKGTILEVLPKAPDFYQFEVYWYKIQLDDSEKILTRSEKEIRAI
ncbi:MAG: hypothetical protein ACI4MH_01745 [Candidatus Coproplasma sp.]